MTNSPDAYPWSSYGRNGLGNHDPLITSHEQYTLLGSTSPVRQAAYRGLVSELLEDSQLDDLRLHTQQQRAWGNKRFQQQIEALTQRSVVVRPRGRPPKPPQFGSK
jgi:putative transposase